MTVIQRPLRHLLLLALMFGITTATAQDNTDRAVVAEINGEPITQIELDQLIAQQTGGNTELPAVQRRQFLEEIINLVLLAQAGEAEGLALGPDLQARINNNRRRALAQAFVRRNARADQISQDMLRERYEAQYGEGVPVEYRARHILVGEAEQAEGLIRRIKEGESFATLAQQHSQDGSAQDGGDLGWFAPGDMVAPFAEAVSALEPGEMTSEPVETRFGWHVIRLDEVRDGEVPAFEAVADQISMQLINERIQAQIDGLRGDARIEYRADWAEPAE